MTVAGKINTLIIVITTLAGCLIFGFSAQREYSSNRVQLLHSTEAAVKGQPQLQYAIYYYSAGGLNATLLDFLSISSTLRSAAIYNASGTMLASLGAGGSSAIEPTQYTELRMGASAVDSTVTELASDLAPPRLVQLSALLGGEKIIHQTLPVFSLVNPNDKNISKAKFAQALTRSAEADSLHVTGYVHFAISRTELWYQTFPSLVPVALTTLGFTLFCVFAATYITRGITAPLTRLAQLASDLSEGNVSQLSLKGSAEMQEITGTLNSIMGGLKTYKSKIDVDHHLLSLKVDERTEQLSRRNKELNKAVKEVTHTKNRLRELAYFDSLTSLPNRRLFTEQLELLIRLGQRNEQTLGLMFLDLDNFKRINDSLGHRAGDLLLKEVALRLTTCVRESDVVAHYVDSESRIDVSRLGGDEFTVVLNQLESPEAAGLVARRLIETLVEPMFIDGHELVVTPSIGIAIMPRDGTNVEELLRYADTAMYHAKASGKNNYLFYRSDMDAAGVERLELESDLRKADQRNELLLHYQPQVDTVTGAVVGVEALMRWQHPERGLVPPFKFIPLAEEMGLISQLGEWCLREACQQMVTLEKEGLSLPRMSVNVSALQFSRGFIDKVADILLDTGLSADKLMLELTEGIVMDDASSTIEALHQLKDMGIKLSIDDFGTGYSSLSYLSRFPLDELKIDRSFVVDLDKSENDASLVIAIIAMGKSMNLELVAEGVETPEQYQFLTRYGAKIIQGYLFSKPVTADELKPLLAPFHFTQQIQEIPRDTGAANDQST